MKEGSEMPGKEKDELDSLKKKPDGSPTPRSRNIPIEENVRELAKKIKQRAKAIGILSEADTLRLMSSMAMGIEKDRFDMDMSASDRLKALALIADYHRKNKEDNSGLADKSPTNIHIEIHDDKDDARLAQIEKNINEGK